MDRGPDRFLPIPESEWTEAQRAIAQKVINGPRGEVVGPFVPLMRSPDLMDRVQATGEYVRYSSAIGQRLTELAILVTARYWDQDVEWAIHAPIAAREGINNQIIRALSHGDRPTFADEDEAMVHDCVVDLLQNRKLADPLFERARSRFGEQGVVDLLGVVGYYTLLSVIMNGAQTAAPPSDAPPLQALDRSGQHHRG